MGGTGLSPTLPFLRVPASYIHPFINKNNNLLNTYSTKSTALDPGDIMTLDSQGAQSEADDRKVSREVPEDHIRR